MPKRIQLRRVKGWRMPAGAVKCDRTTRWGNPYKVGGQAVRQMGGGLVFFTIDHAEEAVEEFRRRAMELVASALFRRVVRGELAGRDLACWCALCRTHADGKEMGVACPDCAPCHVDVLLEIANR